MTQTKNNKIVYFIICTAVTTLLNFLLSDFILSNNIPNQNNHGKIFDILYIQNSGAAFSIFENKTLFLVLFGIFAILILLWLFFKYLDRIELIDCFFLSTLVSGIICNTCERIHFGFVRDFIQIKLFDFPIFNISDILINLSILAIIILIIKKDRKRKDVS